MSNVLKVSLQTAIYSLADRSDELRVSWGPIAKRYSGICGWQNRPFRLPALKRKRIENSHFDRRRGCWAQESVQKLG
jgi:hypothetical protein